MNNALGRRWVEALRSGDYQQTRGALRRSTEGRAGQPPGFCCLGVLCDLVDPNGWSSQATPEGWLIFADSGESMPPPEILELIDLPGYGDESSPSADSLAGDNDTGRSFAEIADTIEEALR